MSAGVMLLAAVLLPAPAGAAGAAGAAALNLPLSMRQMGMGNVSTGGHDVLRSWSNPALLADQAAKGEVAVNGSSMYAGQQTTLAAGGGYAVSDAWTVGGLLSTYSLSFDELNETGASAGTSVGRSLLSAGAAGAWRKDWVRLGAMLKVVSDKVLDNSAGTVAADAGAAFRFDAFRAGVSVRNLGGALRAAADGAPGGETLPMEIRAGVAYRYAPWKLSAAVEHSAVADRDGRQGLGAEWWPVPLLGVRAGLDGLPAAERQLTAGFTVAYRSLGVDYALATHALGLTHRMGVTYAFGPVVEPDPEPALRPARPREAAVAAPDRPAEPRKGRLNLAVSELSAQNVSTGDAAVVADMLRSELVKTGSFNVVEKSNMDKILAEQAFQQTGCTSEECAIKLGKLLNVQRMIVGSFGKLLSSYLLSIRVVDVESGEIVFGESVKGTTVDEIGDSIARLATKLARQVR